MTETLPAARAVRGVTIRAYRALDHDACRRLWAELTEHRSRLAARPPAGRPTDDERDPGAGFEEYLTRLSLTGIWVAEHAGDGGGAEDRAGADVCGFVGLMLDGRSGEIDPVVVTRPMRGRGIGRALLATVVEEGRRRGLRRLTVSPPARDGAALRTLHSAGFNTLTTLTLGYQLAGSRASRPAGRDATIDLYELPFTL
jgi:GNAT superfamily N-acetyltransferase